MAPSPEYDKEPKAPDKSASHVSNEDTKPNLVNDKFMPIPDRKTNKSAAHSVAEIPPHVSSLDEHNLRALLDEAIAYKNPKDRETKSSLFKELLEEVEQDEQACEAAARNLTGCRGSRRGGRGRKALPNSNSLQDLVAALVADPLPKRHHTKPQQQPAPATVSAKTKYGGSLPSGVDTSSLLVEEGGPSVPTTVSLASCEAPAGSGYLATVRCVNPPPLAERRVSASDAHSPHELDALNRRSKPAFPVTYTARATLEIGSGSVGSGRAVTTTTASNQVDSAIPFSCITTPEVVASCNTTPSSSTAVAIDPKPLQLGSAYRAVSSVTSAAPREWPPARASTSTDVDHDGPDVQPRSSPSTSASVLPLGRPAGYGSTASTNDEYKKTFDENGNAVQPPTTTSPVAASSSSQQKKPRRKKSSKNETVIDCRQLDGYMGDKDDVNELLRFIENAETRGPKMRAKHKDDSDDKATKKRSSERRKDKEKVKRASSLEELSRTKLEDLTARSAPAPKPERRSWGDATPSAPASEPERKPPTPLPEPEPEIEPEPVEIAPILPAVPTVPDIPFELPTPPLPDPIVEQADFQTVTKKRKPRRRTDEPPRRTRQPSPRRQESAPPSDRSNDSNDDMDSVHSLPQPIIPAPIPHASYADIARTRSNIPDLIESCNYYTEGETNGDAIRRSDPTPVSVDSEGYPALETRIPEPPPPILPRRNVNKQPPPPRRDRKAMVQTGCATATVVGQLSAEECPAPDVVSSRPPVILLDASAKPTPKDMDGVTFGFDINEQLLGGARRARCDLVRGLDSEEGVEGVEGVEGGEGVEDGAGLRVRAACRALRYLPPPPPADPAHLHHLINYVHTAWEDIIRCDGGKVRYFSE